MRHQDYYGWSLAGSGDLDRDGYDDVITASHKADRVNTATVKMVKDVGMLEVISGKLAVGD